MENCFYVYPKGERRMAGIENEHYQMPYWMLFYLSRDEYYLISYFILKTWQCDIYIGPGGVDVPIGISCQLSLKAIADELKSSVSAIKRVLSHLEKMGLLLKRRCYKGAQYCPDYNLISDMTLLFEDEDCTASDLIELRKNYKDLDLHRVAEQAGDYIKSRNKFLPSK